MVFRNDPRKPAVAVAASGDSCRALPAAEDIRTEARRLWESGRLLRAWLGVEALFPWSLPLVPPGEGQPTAQVAQWKADIEAGCRCAGGEGYRIEYREVGHRRLPRRVVFDAPLDLIGFLGESRAVGEFARLARDIRRRFPVLRDWIEARPLEVLRHAEDWPGLLAVLDWMLDHPRPGCYLRELAIPGVDAGFIEARRGLLWELLDRVLPAAALDPAVTDPADHGFERRFGFRYG